MRELLRNCPLTSYRASRAIALARRRHQQKNKRGITEEAFERVKKVSEATMESAADLGAA